MLFASLLAASGIHPVIVFVPNMSFVGWKERKDAFSSFELLNIDHIESREFERAASEAKVYHSGLHLGSTKTNRWRFNIFITLRGSLIFTKCGELGVPTKVPTLATSVAVGVQVRIAGLSR